MISRIEQETLDIDWFFTNNEIVGCIASAGGKLPRSISENWEKNDLISSFFEDLPIISGVIINPGLSKTIKGKADVEYLSCFIATAEKGIFAFDKTMMNNFLDTNYHLVAMPVTPLKFGSLPNELKNELVRTRYLGNVTEMIDVDQIT